MLKITIETSNAAFDDGAEGAYQCAELLHDVAQRLESGQRAGTIRDSNGNTVGSFDLDAEG